MSTFLILMVLAVMFILILGVSTRIIEDLIRIQQALKIDRKTVTRERKAKENDEFLSNLIDGMIARNNEQTEYAKGLRNGMRLIKTLLFGEDQDYEKEGRDHGDSN